MILIVGTIRLPGGLLEAARPSMASMVEANRAEAGCLEYSYAENVFDPGLIHVKERWRDRGCLDEHFKSTHLAVWRGEWRTHGIGERSLSLYEVSEPTPI